MITYNQNFMDKVNWDERFGGEEYLYGTEPNDFLFSVADKIPANSRVLSLCEGEGRNGVFLAEKGLYVTSVDGSQVGLEKAEKLAKERGVQIEIIHSDLNDFEIEPDSWDAVVMFFGHMPVELRRKVHQSVVKGLKTGGVYILEAYSPEQLKYDTGGPKDISKLFDLNDVKTELAGLDFEIAREIEREVFEGEKHTGISSVTQILARKH